MDIHPFRWSKLYQRTFYQSRYAQKYLSSLSQINGILTSLGTEVIAASISVCAILYIKWENRARKKGKRNYRLEGLTEDEARKLGYRHPDFRYIE